MNLDDVNKGITPRKARKRVGRGIGSGHGRTCGKGDKGHSARSGFSYRLGFEGGQKPLFRSVAKRGFSNNFYAPVVAIVNLTALEANFRDGDLVDEVSLKQAGLLKKAYDAVKILGQGSLTRKLTVKAHRFSQSALDKIAAAGGATEVIL